MELLLITIVISIAKNLCPFIFLYRSQLNNKIAEAPSKIPNKILMYNDNTSLGFRQQFYHNPVVPE